MQIWHNDVIKWEYFPCYWPFVRGIHWSPTDFRHKGQWRRDLMYYLIYAWTNGWADNIVAGDLTPHCAYCDITVMVLHVTNGICLFQNYVNYTIVYLSYSNKSIESPAFLMRTPSIPHKTLFDLMPKLARRYNITMTSHERHVVPNHRPLRCLFNSLCGPHQRNIKVRITDPLWGEFTGDRWIPRTIGQ